MNSCGKFMPCNLLANRIRGQIGEVDYGFADVTSIDITTGKTRWLGVAYKGGRRDKGLMLNFCPFCGKKPGIVKPRKP